MIHKAVLNDLEGMAGISEAAAEATRKKGTRENETALQMELL